ncbi:hypothetical protein J3R82DRAFT_7574 [Butyriboletus roseoflavus]|nr:hypothetical protein J3R82DRAFT_7574 [Butyriboletus roseoflavus]
MLRDGLPRKSMVSQGTILDITQKGDCCAFCRLAADLILRRWRLDDFPDADVQGINYFVSARSCGTLDPDLDERKSAHRLYIHISYRPQDITSVLISATAVLYLDKQLLKEDSWKVARSKDVHGRKKSRTRWTSTSSKGGSYSANMHMEKHAELCGGCLGTEIYPIS